MLCDVCHVREASHSEPCGWNEGPVSAWVCDDCCERCTCCGECVAGSEYPDEADCPCHWWTRVPHEIELDEARGAGDVTHIHRE